MPFNKQTICCIQPPIEDFYSTSVRRQPLGLLYIAASLKQAEYNVELINGHSPAKHKLPLPENFSYLQRHIEDGTFPFKSYYHFGRSWQDMERLIKNSSARIFLVSSLFTPYYEESLTTMKLIGKHHGDASIITGGYHAAQYPHFFLKNGLAHYVICGEGEDTVPQLISALEKDEDPSAIPGLAFIKDGTVCITEKRTIPDINTIPLPMRELLLPRDFTMYRKKAVSMITSRGCPHNCSFCSGKTIWGRSWRKRSVDSVIEEIELCRKNYDISIFNFEDDNLFCSPARTQELLEALIRYREQNNAEIEFTAMNGISLEHIRNNTVQLMHRAGFNELNCSLVTVSPDLQDSYGRPFHTDRIEEIVSEAKKHSMNVRAYFILGLPDQTRQEIEDTISFLRSLDVKIFPSVYYNVFSSQEQWKMQRSSAFFNETKFLSRKNLITLFNKTLSQ
jgi:anaerobic magnesium-protoporphyrin IX monomethyl ester cyclase